MARAVESNLFMVLTRSWLYLQVLVGASSRELPAHGFNTLMVIFAGFGWASSRELPAHGYICRFWLARAVESYLLMV